MEKGKIKNVLILAAGRGKRLMPLTKNLPKCLVGVGGNPILFYQLTALKRVGLKNVILAVGYQGGKIKDYVGAHFADLDFQFVYNKDYSVTNDIHSLYLARGHLNEDTVILDSDVLFHPAILDKLLEIPEKTSAVCLRRGLCGEEEMKIGLKLDGTVKRLSKGLGVRESAGEFMGVSLFSAGFLDALIPFVEEIVTAGGVKLDREAAIERVIGEKCGRLYCVDVTGYPVMEIDFPEDRLKAEKEILPRILV